ncbi:MAG: thiol:disulfide interchange protein [Akkermansiaceae bacterium]
MQADDTIPDPRIKADLARFNRSNLPVNIVVPSDPDQPLIMLPEFISPAEALQALEEAQGL